MTNSSVIIPSVRPGVHALNPPRHDAISADYAAQRAAWLPDVPPKPKKKRILNGSPAKTAFALRVNAERMIKEGGLNSAVLMTLTAGDYDADGKFHNIKSAAEASRRWNLLNRRIIKDLFERGIVVTERHKKGGIHFHVLGTLAGRPDVRTGFDFAAVARKDYRSASEHLREIWAILRDILPRYGFGRAETLPIQKTGLAVAAYVSKYIEKNISNRGQDDRGKKLVRYIGWNKGQLKPNGFAWASENSTAWRLKTKQSFALVNIQEPEQAAEALGPRWAFHVLGIWMAVNPEPSPGLIATFPERQIIAREIVRKNERWFNRREIHAQELATQMNRRQQWIEDDESFDAWCESRERFSPEFNTLGVNNLQNN